MRRTWIGVAAILFLCHAKGPLAAAENLRAASGGFTTAIHAVLWAAYEEKIFRKYGLDVEYLALNTGRLGMQMLLSDDIQILFSTGVTVVATNLQKADLAIIGGGLNFFPTKLIVRPEIKKPRRSQRQDSGRRRLWRCQSHGPAGSTGKAGSQFQRREHHPSGGSRSTDYRSHQGCCLWLGVQ